MTKISKSESNALNAQKSTGPKTAVGKATSSQNARSHGVLSAQLIIPGESRDEFDALFGQLQQEFKPQGLLEMTLTERIAIAIWRQRRLVSAESAEIALYQKSALSLAVYAIRTASGAFATNELIAKEWLGESDFDDLKSSAELLALTNVWKMASYKVTDIADFSHQHPALYKELLEDAKEADYTNPKLFIEQEFNNLAEYMSFKCKFYLESQQHAVVRELIKVYKDSIALPKHPEKMSRYQSALDNDLYKSMRALRDAQNWRSERREAEASVVTANSDQ
jgi:hypothetical protein